MRLGLHGTNGQPGQLQILVSMRVSLDEPGHDAKKAQSDAEPGAAT